MSDYPELRKLQDIIDQQADRILDLEAALRTIRFEIDSQCGPLTVDTPRAALTEEQDKT